jgi:hypothetical protein
MFAEIVPEILRRFSVQNGREPPDEVALSSVAARLWQLVQERGLPPPLGASEAGTPVEIPDETCAPLVERTLEPVSERDREWLRVPVRQLIKACFHGEFKICRDSFREVSPDGSCRRQQLSRVKQRVSGTHCIDCPYWVALPPETHRRFIEREWQPGGREELRFYREIFLPEDFRRMRRLLHAHARNLDIGL